MPGPSCDAAEPVTSPPLVSRPALRAAVAGDAATLAGLRHEFRGGLAPAVEAEAAFLERCTGWMSRRLAAGSAWQCWVAEGRGGMHGFVVREDLLERRSRHSPDRRETR